MGRVKNVWPVPFALLVLGCGNPEEAQINEAKSRLRFISSDPSTVMFNDIKVGTVDGEPKVCGYVNMKLKGQSEMTGASPFVVGRAEGDYWVETLGGDCEFDVLFQPCHRGEDPKPWRERCDAQIAEFDAEQKEWDARTARLLACHGLTSTGDVDRDHAAILREITANRYAPGKGPNSPECQV